MELSSLSGRPDPDGATDATLRAILVDVTGLSSVRAAALGPDSGLFGALPELDSMAVATLLGEIEERFDLTIADDEIDGSLLETFGALLAFVDAKRAA